MQDNNQLYKHHTAVRFENYSDCLIGAAQTFRGVVYVYDKELIVKKIQETSLCDYREALRFFEANFLNNMGELSPVFFTAIQSGKEILV
jgi:hypothetical protein